jgi:outer membrane protein assembly factor BamE (lipoprotein component of BamABCDE complex)
VVKAPTFGDEKIMRHLLLALPLVALLGAGCSRIPDLKGYIADETLVTAVQPGVDTKASVQKTLGRPSMVSEFDENTWYYVSRRTEQLAFFRPKPVEHQVLVMRFDAGGKLLKVEKLGKEQLVAVNPSDDKTPTRGKEQTFLQQLLGDVGRVAPAGAGGPPQQ